MAPGADIGLLIRRESTNADLPQLGDMADAAPDASIRQILPHDAVLGLIKTKARLVDVAPLGAGVEVHGVGILGVDPDGAKESVVI